MLEKMKTLAESDGQILQICSSPDWSYIDSARLLVMRLCDVDAKDEQACHDVALAATELIENAVKYSDGRDPLYVDVRRDEERIQISVSNKAGDSQIAILVREVAKAMQGDPFENYSQRIEALMLDDDCERAMLGLLRIRYECGVDLETQITGNRVAVLATYHLATEGEEPT